MVMDFDIKKFMRLNRKRIEESGDMACVVYECMDCGEFWYKGSGAECPVCDGTNINYDWDEEADFSKVSFSDANGLCEEDEDE